MKKSPLKQTIPDFKGTGNRLKRSMGQTVTGLSDERSADKIINTMRNTTKKLKPLQDSFTEYMDWNDDGKVTTSDVVKEAATWLIPGGAFVKGAKYLNKARKFLSPFKHCDSEMMHSGGWGQVRKYNSPGTTGNKEAIKHNKEIMSKIGTFKMPHHSPLNKGHEVNQDSIASAKAWKAHKAEYLKKEGGQEEYDREKGEFFYSPKHKKLRLIPTDDGEVQDRTGIEKWQLAPDRKSSALHQEPEAQKRRRKRAESESGETQFFYSRKPDPSNVPPGVKEKVYNMTPNVSEEEAKAVRDKFDATYMQSINPINFKGANSENSKCWDGYVKKGTKPSPTRPGVTVNNCVKK